ncbi:MAG: hypothetical protein LIO79_03265 [Rikenellaceae bacterium]|nr:hypothetical protein [Rikenellaceae bacterium]
MILKRSLIINILVWTALIVYMVFAVRHCSVRNSGIVCSGLNIVVKDSARYRFVTPQSIEDILKSKGIGYDSVRLDSVNIAGVERALAENPYIKQYKVYTTLNGKLNIELRQRKPLVRIQSDNGYKIYITDDMNVVPVNNFHVDVPVVTGMPQLPFDKDFIGCIFAETDGEKKSDENNDFIHNLINFVNFLNNSTFWSAQIVQINVISGNQIELVPRAGDQIILLGELDGYKARLDKLMKFYTKGLPYEGWNRYKYIDLRFKDQVICRT